MKLKLDKNLTIEIPFNVLCNYINAELLNEAKILHDDSLKYVYETAEHIAKAKEAYSRAGKILACNCDSGATCRVCSPELY